MSDLGSAENTLGTVGAARARVTAPAGESGNSRYKYTDAEGNVRLGTTGTPASDADPLFDPGPVTYKYTDADGNVRIGTTGTPASDADPLFDPGPVTYKYTDADGNVRIGTTGTPASDADPLFDPGPAPSGAAEDILEGGATMNRPYGSQPPGNADPTTTQPGAGDPRGGGRPPGAGFGGDTSPIEGNEDDDLEDLEVQRRTADVGMSGQDPTTTQPGAGDLGGGRPPGAGFGGDTSPIEGNEDDDLEDLEVQRRTADVGMSSQDSTPIGDPLGDPLGGRPLVGMPGSGPAGQPSGPRFGNDTIAGNEDDDLEDLEVQRRTADVGMSGEDTTPREDVGDPLGDALGRSPVGMLASSTKPDPIEADADPLGVDTAAVALAGNPSAVAPEPQGPVAGSGPPGQTEPTIKIDGGGAVISMETGQVVPPPGAPPLPDLTGAELAGAGGMASVATGGEGLESMPHAVPEAGSGEQPPGSSSDDDGVP